MRGVNMTLQKCQKKNIAKKFEFKFEILFGISRKLFFFSLSFTSEKCPRCRINSPENFDIYMSYIKIIYIFLYFPFSLIQKKRESPRRQPGQPAQPAPSAAHQRARRRPPTPEPACPSARCRTPSPSLARSLPSPSPSLTRGARPLSFPSPTLCRARARSPPPPPPSSTGSRSEAAPSSKLMSYKYLCLSSLDPPKTLSSTPPVARALAERISPPPPWFAAVSATGEHPPCIQATPPEPSVRSSSP